MGELAYGPVPASLVRPLLDGFCQNHCYYNEYWQGAENNVGRIGRMPVDKEKLGQGYENLKCKKGLGLYDLPRQQNRRTFIVDQYKCLYNLDSIGGYTIGMLSINEVELARALKEFPAGPARLIAHVQVGEDPLYELLVGRLPELSVATSKRIDELVEFTQVHGWAIGK